MMTDTNVEKLRQYLKYFLVHKTVDNAGQTENYLEFWKKREEATKEIRGVIQAYLNDDISLKEFKEQNEVLCRTYPYWGFKNFSGQMQLNQYYLHIKDGRKESVLKETLRLPSKTEEAGEKIDIMADYLAGLKLATDNPKAIPRKNLSYLLSYFWEIQEIGKIPVFYGSSSKKILVDLNLMEESYESPGREYVAYSDAIKSVVELFYKEGVDMGDNPYWFVEHVFWSKYMDKEEEVVKEPKYQLKLLPLSENHFEAENMWIPPVVSDLEDLAFNRETDWTRDRNIKPEKAFETKLKYLFTLMGYEAEELGQGRGREPDGVAISRGVEGGDYAIVYDAKARENHYSIGTQDREISEYINTKKQTLRAQRINKMYFLVVSSEFKHDSNNTQLIREIYRRTQVPVVFMKASDLLFILENKLKNSDLSHDHIEDIFLDTGTRTREEIVDLLSNKIEL